MPFKNMSDWNESHPQTYPYGQLEPVETYLAFATEDDTLVISKKVWNQKSRKYDDALVVKFDAAMLANLGERLDKIEQMVQKLGASVRKLQRNH